MMTSLIISISGCSSRGASDTSSAGVVAYRVCVRASVDEVGLSLTSREALWRPCPCSEHPDDLRDVPERLDCAVDCVLDVEPLRFELKGW